MGLMLRIVQRLCFLLVFTCLAAFSARGFIANEPNDVTSLLDKAQKSSSLGKFEESMWFAKKALSISLESRNLPDEADSRYMLGQIFLALGNTDSSSFYLHESFRLYNQLSDYKGVADAYNQLGTLHYRAGDYDSAIIFYNRSLGARATINDSLAISHSLNNIGMIYDARGDYASALSYFYRSLEIKKRLGDSLSYSRSLGNIGSVYLNQGDYPKSLSFFMEALAIREKFPDPVGIAYLNRNIGKVITASGDYNLALSYLNHALSLLRDLDDDRGIALTLTYMGPAYQAQARYDSALICYDEAISLYQQVDEPSGLAEATVLKGIVLRIKGQFDESLQLLREAQTAYNKLGEPRGAAWTLIELSSTYMALGDYALAKRLSLDALSKAQSIRATSLQRDVHELLSEIFSREGDCTKSYYHFKRHVAFRDSLGARQLPLQLVQVNLEKELQRQRLEQQARTKTAELESKRQRYIANFFMFAFLSMIVVSVLTYLNLLQKRRHNVDLERQKLAIEQQNREIIEQRNDIESHRNLVVQQRDRIINLLTELGESIDYAKRIQQAIMPTHKFVEEHFSESFILSLPRESVGGDFFWATYVDSKLYFAVADCTGHGIPGGFMSMLGLAYLNQIVAQEKLGSPAQMLGELRSIIIKALNQTGKDDDSYDGMDIALCVFDPKTYKLTFAGANSPLYVACNRTPVASAKVIRHGIISELKPDRMPVGYYPVLNPFTEVAITLAPGDMLYLFSDGFPDQFGGPLNKKFGHVAFRELLSGVVDLPLDEQQRVLFAAFDRHKAEYPQTDDVFVVGIKV